jgi:hypothetical protein
MSFADLYVLSSPAAWLLWFVVLALAMYFARLPAHRAILSLARALHRALRLIARSLLLAEDKLRRATARSCSPPGARPRSASSSASSSASTPPCGATSASARPCIAA